MNRRTLLGVFGSFGVAGLSGCTDNDEGNDEDGGLSDEVSDGIGELPDGVSGNSLDTDVEDGEEKWFSAHPFIDLDDIAYGYTAEWEFTRTDLEQEEPESLEVTTEVIRVPGEYGVMRRDVEDLHTEYENVDTWHSVQDFSSGEDTVTYFHRQGEKEFAMNASEGDSINRELLFQPSAEDSNRGYNESVRWGDFFIPSNFRMSRIGTMSGHKSGFYVANPTITPVKRVESVYGDGGKNSVLFEIDSIQYFYHATFAESFSGTARSVTGEVVIHDEGVLESIEYTVETGLINTDGVPIGTRNIEGESFTLSHTLESEFGESVRNQSYEFPDWYDDLKHPVELDVKMTRDMIIVEHVGDTPVIGPIEIRAHGGTEHEVSRLTVQLPRDFTETEDGQGVPEPFMFEPGDTLYMSTSVSGSRSEIGSVNAPPSEDVREPFREDRELLDFTFEPPEPVGVMVYSSGLSGVLGDIEFDLDYDDEDVITYYERYTELNDQYNQPRLTALLTHDPDPDVLGSE